MAKSDVFEKKDLRNCKKIPYHSTLHVYIVASMQG
jgi:hypothetical protein